MTQTGPTLKLKLAARHINRNAQIQTQSLNIRFANGSLNFLQATSLAEAARQRFEGGFGRGKGSQEAEDDFGSLRCVL